MSKILNKFLKPPKIKDENFTEIPDMDVGKLQDVENCEHTFLPIDSTGEVLACIKCGIICHKKDLKKKNPFD